METFIDSANPTEVEAALATGVVSGVTTNPVLLQRASVACGTSARETLSRLGSCLRGTELPLSVQVCGNSPADVVGEAHLLASVVQYDHVLVKHLVGPDSLACIHALSEAGFVVNATGVMTSAQANLAMAAGAGYVSLFWNKSAEQGLDPVATAEQIMNTILNSYSGRSLIVGSLDDARSYTAALKAGVTISTVPLALLHQLSDHNGTRVAQQLFEAAYQPLREHELTRE